MKAAVALLEQEEESAQEGVSSLYSLHSLDYSDINFHFISYLTT